MSATPAEVSASVRVTREIRVGADIPFLVQPEWHTAYPWLAQGVTARAADQPFDMSLFGDTPSGVIQSRWAALRRFLSMDAAVHARQVHGSQLLHHSVSQRGLFVAEAADGHVTREAGVLMTVSIADCVPVSIVDPRRKAAALLHAGWRGVAAGILEKGVVALREQYRCEPTDLEVHLGPAICGSCYEVGPEVHAALQTAQRGPAPVDLRALLWQRARRLGIVADRITSSTYCTKCDGTAFHSHRAGARERQIAVLGIRKALAD